MIYFEKRDWGLSGRFHHCVETGYSDTYRLFEKDLVHRWLGLKPEVVLWMNETFGHDGAWIWTASRVYDRKWFLFNNKNDALMFMLRWK